MYTMFGELIGHADRNTNDQSHDVSENLNMNSYRITNVTNPIDNSDVATRIYVDEGDNYRVLRTGDVMSGDLRFSYNTEDNLRIFGINNMSNNKQFQIFMGTRQNFIHYKKDDKAPKQLVIKSSDGVSIFDNNTLVVNLGINSEDKRASFHQDIVMNNCYIAGLHDPGSEHDAATKGYIDKQMIKNQTGLIPPLTDNEHNVSGFMVFSNSQAPKNKAYNVFSNEWNEWTTTAIVKSNFYIKVACPNPVLIWKFQLRGRITEGGSLSSWRLDASNDAEHYTTLMESETTVTNWVHEFILNPIPTTAYNNYRIYCVASTGGSSPGLSYWQLFTLDSLL